MERLCADAEVELVTRFPATWPDDRVDVAIRRNVLLVGLEALHNAVRHAGADRIELSLLPHGREWELRIRDNGRGFDLQTAGTNGRRGHGLRSMQWRAEEIGGDLDLTATPHGGTTVVLRFALRPRSSNRVDLAARRSERTMRQPRT